FSQDPFEVLDPAGRAPDLQHVGRGEHRHTGRVIAPVLELLETLDNDVHRALVTDVPDDSAHCRQPSFLGVAARARRRLAHPSFVTCGLRSTASASGGTSLVITAPEPMEASSPIVSGA